MDDASLGQQLAQIHSCLEGIDRRLEVIEVRVEEITSIPQAVTYEQAAHLLSCGVKVIRRMIGDRKLKTTVEKIGERKRIPMAEIFRLTATSTRPSSTPAPLAANERALAKVRAKSRAEQKKPGDAIRELAKRKD